MKDWAERIPNLSLLCASLSWMATMAAMVPVAQAQDLSDLIKVRPGRSFMATGFLPADPEKYRALDAAPRTRGFLPAKVDLSDRFPPPQSQGEQGSCSAWAVGYAARSYYVGRESGGDLQRGENVVSPAYIYNTLNKTGNCQTQVSTYDALELLKNKGAVPLSATGYREDDCVTQVPDTVLAAHAQRFRVQGYNRVDKDAASIKSQLSRNNPVIFAINLTDEFFTWDQSVFTSTTKNGKAHAMVITGYDDARQSFKFINSWGKEWGEGGYGWLTYKAVAALWVEGYVMSVGTAQAAPQ